MLGHRSAKSSFVRTRTLVPPFGRKLRERDEVFCDSNNTSKNPPTKAPSTQLRCNEVILHTLKLARLLLQAKRWRRKYSLENLLGITPKGQYVCRQQYRSTMKSSTTNTPNVLFRNAVIVVVEEDTKKTSTFLLRSVALWRNIQHRDRNNLSF